MTDTRSADSPASAGDPGSSEFDDAFSAFANGDEPAPASEPAPGEPAATPQEPAAGEPEPRADPAPRPEEAAPSGPAPQSAEIDWSSVDPRVREAYEAADRERKTHRETLSRQGRELHDLRQRPAAPTPTPAPAAAPAAKGPTEEQIAAFREDYPDIADFVLGVAGGIDAKVTGVVQQSEEARTASALERNAASLAEAMPDWQTWGSDQRLDAWLAGQPRYVQEAAARNAEYIVDADEARDVLERFKAAHSTGTPAPAPTTDPKRERQLGAGRDSSTKAPAVAAGVPDDFDAAFDTYSKVANAKAAQRI